jgi:beta-lactamase class A
MTQRWYRHANWVLASIVAGNLLMAACRGSPSSQAAAASALPTPSEPAREMVPSEPTSESLPNEPAVTLSGDSIRSDAPEAALASVAGSEPPARWSRATLQANLESWERDHPGVYGLVVSDLATGTRYSINAQEPFPPASLYKLLILVETYRQIERGSLALTDRFTVQPGDAAQEEPEGGLGVGDEVTVEQAIEAIAQLSSNTAAWLVIRIVGWDALVATAKRLDLPDTHFCCMAGEPAVTTAEDLATFFELLAQKEIVSPWASQEIIDQLAQSQVNDRIPAGLPADTVVAHKTGDLEDVVHDAGIVYGPRGPLVFVFLSKEVSYEQGTKNLRHLARQIYTALAEEGADPSSSSLEATEEPG